MTPDHIRQEAARWFIELDTADRIEDLWPRFEDWINENPAHRAAFIRCERGWKALDALAEHYRGTGRPRPQVRLFCSPILGRFDAVWAFVKDGSSALWTGVRRALRRLLGRSND